MREPKELEEAYNTFCQAAHRCSILSREHSDCIAMAATIQWVLGNPKYSEGIELILKEWRDFLKNKVSG